MEAATKKREEQSRRLYKIFGDKVVLTQRNREISVKDYQKNLEEQEFGDNGGKLRDYQAEGVSWLISNYVNSRSSILADEVRSVVLCGALYLSYTCCVAFIYIYICMFILICRGTNL